MPAKRTACLALALILLLTLPACGPKAPAAASSSQPDVSEPDVSVLAPVPLPEPQPEPTPEPEPQPAPEFVNPLTGEITEADLSQNRPVAVVLNNLKKALPQLGVAQADVIYEAPAEGGVTRMLGLFQSVDGVGNIGSVRSARDYYVSLALGHDAVLLHAGGSPKAYAAIEDWGVTALDCIHGPYEGTLYWRDAARRKSAGFEHSVLTSGKKISELLPTYQKVTLTHKKGFTYPLSFLPAGERAGGVHAESISVRFSSYKTGVFTYDQETALYKVSEYDAPYVDGNTGEQLAVKNVLMLYTDVSVVKGDDAGRLTVRTTGTGTGKFFCDGRAQEITWSKKSESAPLTYRSKDGGELKLGVGASYVNLVPTDAKVTVG